MMSDTGRASPIDRRCGRARAVVAIAAAMTLALGGSSAAAAQGTSGTSGGVQRDTVLYQFDPIVLTATRTPQALFRIPAPVSVVDLAAWRGSKPNTVTELFRDLPGLDVTGVGVQQPRPVIRGQRGQRILLMQDGLRLNNTRRQQDFGELPALIDVNTIGRVEIVRGPASVLYGTDAIGGVINLITRGVERDGVHGAIGYLYGQQEEQHRGNASVEARQGAFSVRAILTKREAEDYTAPAGSFGALDLERPTLVKGTGVRDESVQLRLGYDVGDRHDVFVRADHYSAKDAGFGFVEPDAYAPDLPRIDIQYPRQRFRKYTLGYHGTGLNAPLADAIEVLGYVQDNERNLDFDLFTSFGPQAPPGAGVAIQTFNYTDVGTAGFRVEARKLAIPALLLTYGVDFFRDDSENTDSSVTTVTGFGPPSTEVANTPLVPNATFRSVGAFVQGEMPLTSRLTMIAGGRVQDVHAEAAPGPATDEARASKTNRTVVGALNALYLLGDGFSAFASVGRAFRSPNLIEWFFEGPTPEGNGYQVANPDLAPETSVSVDVGLRYRRRGLALEATAFRATVHDGIRIAPLDREVNGLDAFHNVNVDELVYRGIELWAEAALPAHLTIAGGLSHIESEDELDPTNPVGESFSTKLNGSLRYVHPSDRLWAEYTLRHNGERRDVLLEGSPIGDVLPAFTVHGVRGGVTLLRRAGHEQRISIAVRNLTDALFAEFSNISFFRPEPRRSLSLSWEMRF